MIPNNEETKKDKMDRVMEVLLNTVKQLNSGDNITIECPICGNELNVYKPFKKRVAAKCKSDNCIKIWD